MNKLLKRTLAAAIGGCMVLTVFAGAQLAKRAAEPSATAEAAPLSLLAHYDFNGVSGGSVPDATGHGYDGTLDGSDYTASEEFVTFNEKSDANYGSGVRLGKNPFADTEDDLTITAWIRPSTPSNENAIRTLFNLNRTTTPDVDNYAVLITKFNGEGLRYLNGAVLQVNTVLTANQWNLLTLVQKKNTCSMYLNDALVATVEFPRRLCDISSGIVTFAKGITWPDKGFRGAIDDIKIYNGAMDELQIAQEYQKTMYPIAGFSVDGYNAAIDQQKKQMILSLPEAVSLENVSPVIVSNASELTLNGQPFHEGDRVTLQLGENQVGYTLGDDSGVYTLDISREKLEKLAEFDFSAKNADAGTFTNNGYTAKLAGTAQAKDDFVNLNGGYIDVDPNLIANTKAALTLSFTVSLEKSAELLNTLFSAGAVNTGGRLMLATAARPDCEGPRWGMKTSASGESLVRSDQFLPYGKWMHLTFTQSNAVAKIYLNGVCLASGTSLLPASTIGAVPAYIGKSTDPSEGSSGLLGQVARFSVYTGAMSDAQVAQLHADEAFPNSFESGTPSNAACDLLGFAYPEESYKVEIEDYVIHVQTDSNEPLGEPTVTVAQGASYKIERNLLLITAANGLDQLVYRIEVDAPDSSVAQLEQVTVNDRAATIDEAAGTVSVELPAGTDLSLVVVDATAKENGSVQIENGKLTVTAEDGQASRVYTLQIDVAKSSVARIRSVTVNGKAATVDQAAKTVKIELAAGEAVKEIAVTVDENGSYAVAADNKSITVTAEDGKTTAVYTLEITNAAPSPDSGRPSEPSKPNPSTTHKNQVVGTTAYDANGNPVTGTKIVKIGAVRYAVVGGKVQTGTKIVKIGSARYALVKGKVQTGTKVVKVGSARYALVKGKVQTGTKVVKVGKTYRALKSGKVLYAGKAKVVKLGKRRFAVSKKGIVRIKKLVKVGKKQYVNQSKRAGIYRNKTFKLKGKVYVANRTGAVTLKK